MKVTFGNAIEVEEGVATPSTCTDYELFGCDRPRITAIGNVWVDSYNQTHVKNWAFEDNWAFERVTVLLRPYNLGDLVRIKELRDVGLVDYGPTGAARLKCTPKQIEVMVKDLHAIAREVRDRQ